MIFIIFKTDVIPFGCRKFADQVQIDENIQQWHYLVTENCRAKSL